MHTEHIPSDTTRILEAYLKHSIRYNKYIFYGTGPGGGSGAGGDTGPAVDHGPIGSAALLTESVDSWIMDI